MFYCYLEKWPWTDQNNFSRNEEQPQNHEDDDDKGDEVLLDSCNTNSESPTKQTPIKQWINKHNSEKSPDDSEEMSSTSASKLPVYIIPQVCLE